MRQLSFLLLIANAIVGKAITIQGALQKSSYELIYIDGFSKIIGSLKMQNDFGAIQLFILQILK